MESGTGGWGVDESLGGKSSVCKCPEEEKTQDAGKHLKGTSRDWNTACIWVAPCPWGGSTKPTKEPGIPSKHEGPSKEF